MSSWFSDFVLWLDDRLGLSEIRSALFNRSLPGRSRLPYVFFNSFVVLFLFQSLTGICLALYYVPSADHAHTTVDWIDKGVAGGALIRSLHDWGTTIMLLLLLLHLVQVFISRLGRDRDELTWIFSCGLIFLTLGFALTGQLLPWDQNGYFSTRALLAGIKPGTIMLSRFYALHAMVLPAMALSLICMHLLTARKSRSNSRFSLELPIISVSAVAILAIVAVLRRPLLEPIANPLDVQYFPHPGWFFVPVFQFLKSGAGRNVIAALLFVVVLLVITFGIPFLSRKLASASLIGIVFIVFGLSVSARHDEAAPEIRGRLQRQAFLAAEEAAKPFVPDQMNSRVTIVRDRIPPAPQQFAACAECHGDLGGGGMIGPDLINVGKNYNSPEQLEAVLLDPQGHGIAVGQMPRFTDDRMPAHERKALIEYLTSLPKN